MSNRKTIYVALSSLLTLSFILLFIINSQRKQNLKVVFFNVGQGDSILISQGSKQLLIDGGKDGKLLLQELGEFIPFWDRKIETVIETHPDADHIGGLVEVFKSYEVQSIIKTEAQSDSQTFKVLEELIGNEKSEIIEARSGEKIKFSQDAEVDIIFPLEKIAENIKDTNSASVTLKLAYGDNKFLFTGDLPIEQEKEILNKNVDVKADVLKVGHHGSKYSTSDEFMRAVSPSDAIISVGKNNSYGHPHADILKKLNENKINVLRTDEIGDIVYECQNPNEKCQRVDSYYN